MSNILIIKLGAMGDVIRTTPLLHVLEGNIFWVTEKNCLSLLPKKYIHLAVDIEATNCLKDIFFDLVLCLDDEYKAAALANSLNKQTLIGSYLNEDGTLTYTNSSAEWFDIGLISRFGKDKADIIKMKNERTYQDLLFAMVGKKFNAEEYLLNLNGVNYQKNTDRLLIGIESRAGDKWPMKQWNKYHELACLFKKDGYNTRFFKYRENIFNYIQDIMECDVVICGDTLSMHIALALKKRVVSIFTCTSPEEIYGYKRMTKIISPLLNQFFYKREYSEEPINAISLESVYSAVRNSCMTL